MRRRPAPAKRQQGYILALNIAVLAMMLVGATYLGQRLSLATKLAQAEQQRIEDDLALESARSRVLFLLATAARTRSGLGVGERAVALDGRPYRLVGNVIVGFQDVRGLVNIGAADSDLPQRLRVGRLLATYGIDVGEADKLTDALLDYRDADELRRINGAERDEYAAAGQAELLRNNNLLVPSELGRVFGWAAQVRLWGDDPVSDHVGLTRRSAFNPNTAGWRALVAMSGITPEIAKSLVNDRRRGALADISRLVFGAGIGDPFSGVGFVSTYPSETILITLRAGGAPWGHRLAVTHTPTNTLSPWHVEYADRVPLPPLETPLDKIPALPEAEALRDFDAKDRIELPF